jgi:hypothetical protein
VCPRVELPRVYEMGVFFSYEHPFFHVRLRRVVLGVTLLEFWSDKRDEDLCDIPFWS